MMHPIWRILRQIVDLFRLADAAELAQALVTAGISNRSALRRTLHQTRRAGRFVADALQTSTVLKSKAQLGEELEIAFNPGLAARDPERYLDYALALPARIAAADHREVVVFFDEFQEIASPQHPYGDPDRSPSGCARSSSAPPESATSSRAAWST